MFFSESFMNINYLIHSESFLTQSNSAVALAANAILPRIKYYL